MNKLLNEGIKKLKENNIDESLAVYLYNYIDDIDNFKQGIDDIIKGIPIQYIIGNVDFYGLKILVNNNVLIPRFETEELVDRVIKYVNKNFNRKIEILDLCTGSGCIALALKNSLSCDVDAVDISIKALQVAKLNAEKLNLQVDFYLGNLFDPVTKKYDLIISNPPYIAEDENIMPLVANNEPHLALYASNNGLKFYQDIIDKADEYLKEDGIIAFEIGETQGNQIKKLAEQKFPNADIKIEKDLQKRDRYVFISPKM